MLTKDEQAILESIVVASDNDPLKPEFPASGPKFPATPTYQIQVPRFSNVWLKDESVNPTGTHKDRMAWEIVVTYRDFLLAEQRGQTTGPLPAMSLISSGSAAVAIQTQLNTYKLPSLKVLVDASLHEESKQELTKLGCELYYADLSKRPLSSKEHTPSDQQPHWF
jgi:cysteine synthase